MKYPTRLLWIDLEMTGLQPDKDKITEVAMIATDFGLNELAVYETSIRHSEAVLRRLLANPWHAAQPEYTEQKIIDSLSGKTEELVQKEIVSFICEHIGLSKKPEEFPFFPGSLEAKGEIYLAGNSISTDRAFIDAQWPLFARTLHYRMLDVSSFKLWTQGTKHIIFKKQNHHRALVDIRESISELRFYIAQR